LRLHDIWTDRVIPISSQTHILLQGIIKCTSLLFVGY